MTLLVDPVEERSAPRRSRRVRRRRRTSLFAGGEPMVWMTGGALSLALMMIAGLLLLVLVQGGRTFWPQPLVALRTADGGAFLGEVTACETYQPALETLSEAERAALEPTAFHTRRRLVRTGNFDLTGQHFRWIADFQVVQESVPEWGVVVERLVGGRFHGSPAAFELDGERVAESPAEAWELFLRHHEESRDRFHRRKDLETHDIGKVNQRLESARLDLRAVELAQGKDSPAWKASRVKYEQEEARAEQDFVEIRARIDLLDRENEGYRLVLATEDGREKALTCGEIVRAYPANQLGLVQSMGVYLSRWVEFLLDDPREANSEGGVFPAIFGTVAMTLIMSVVVVPFGVLAALYLREYAKPGKIVSMVRIAVNNLAGVPSIVFGVFGLGFFCYILGAGFDQLFYSAKLPSPTFGTGGLLWASLTLALLTLPVVIVATEEALAAVPSSMREGSYACGATKWQTIRRIVLPRAAPGIMTGMILAIARGAGEVAPLMLVGAVKLAPELPVDVSDWSGTLGPLPTGLLHLDRSFMHLGFHIFDLGFQSQNSEAAKPMVYTTTLLLILIVVVLNLLAVWIRARLSRRFQAVHI